MELEALVSTMNLKDFGAFVQQRKITGPALVVDQTDAVDEKILRQRESAQVLVRSQERGLSRSRNLALEFASADLGLFVDDDEVLNDHYEERIITAFQTRPRADVIAFSVQHLDTVRKKPLASNRLSRIELMKVTSVQIAFRRASILKSGVRFDTRFGAGSTYPMGEEFIFLSDLHRAGLRVEAVPLEIAALMPSSSTWFHAFDEAYLRARGAAFYRADPHRCYPYILQWWVRKRSLLESRVGGSAALKCLVEGAMALRNQGMEAVQ